MSIKSIASPRTRKAIRILLWLVAGFAAAIGCCIAILAWWPLPAEVASGILKAPAGLTATPGSGLVSLSWEPTPGAVFYRVERSQRSDGGFRSMSTLGGPITPLLWRFFHFYLPGAPVDAVPRSPFMDSSVQPGRAYWYRVSAWDGAHYSAPSAAVSATITGQTGASIRLRVDAGLPARALNHGWEPVINISELGPLMIGPHADELKRANAILREDVGVRYVRTLGIFADSLGTVGMDASGRVVYDWRGIDRAYGALLNNGLKPWVVLSFMPRALARDPKQTLFGAYISSQPKDYGAWAQFIAAFARHLVDRYGIEEVSSWYFEVWEEPDFHMPVADFWHGTLDEYFRLYDVSAAALKSVDARLRVGGPTAAVPDTIESFLKHVSRAHAPLDFASFHIYSTPPPDWRPLLERLGFSALPVYVSEWGLSGREGEAVNDLPYGAAWVAASIMQMGDASDLPAYWTGSDISPDMASKKFLHGGFGLLGFDNVRKPRFWAYRMLHSLGRERLQLHGDGDGFGTLVHALATRGEDGGLRALVANVTPDQSEAEGNPLLSRRVALEVSGLEGKGPYVLRHFRIDNSHGNILAAWKAMGSPASPSAAQLEQLHRTDRLEQLEAERTIAADEAGRLLIDFEMPMPSLSLIEITKPAQPR